MRYGKKIFASKKKYRISIGALPNSKGHKGWQMVMKGTTVDTIEKVMLSKKI